MSVSAAGIIGAAAAGSAASGGASMLSQYLGYRYQKKLLADQYLQYFENARKAGATPSAIIQGLTGSVPTMPSASSGVSMPDLGNSIVSGYNAASQSALNQQNISNLETERENKILEMSWQPKLWQSSIDQAMSVVARNKTGQRLDKTMSSYYHQLAIDLVSKRPWQIKQMKQGLQNMLAEYDKIRQETKTSKSQEFLNRSGIVLNQKLGGLYDSQKDLNYSNKFNIDQDGYRLLYENGLRASGFNPSKSPWDNIFTLGLSDPPMFRRRLDDAINVLQVLDNKLKEGLGTHYKRNVGLGLAAHYVNSVIGKHNTAKAQRFNLYGRTISGFIPFAGGSSSNLPIVPYGDYSLSF